MILELTSALNTMLSDAVSPRTILPSVPAAKVTTPTKNELPVTNRLIIQRQQSDYQQYQHHHQSELHQYQHYLMYLLWYHELLMHQYNQHHQHKDLSTQELKHLNLLHRLLMELSYYRI